VLIHQFGHFWPGIDAIQRSHNGIASIVYRWPDPGANTCDERSSECGAFFYLDCFDRPAENIRLNLTP
jgi:hypothetical protein